MDTRREHSRQLESCSVSVTGPSLSDSSAPLALEAQQLTKRFGERTAVDGVSLSLKTGTILGLLGANGAGKTTTLRMLTGLLPADAGEIRYFGRDFREERYALKRLIGVCTQHDTLDHDLTVRQNLSVYASYFRPRIDNVSARIQELLARFSLSEYADASPSVLSGGFKQRLLIARAVVHSPRLLFLDEPTTGLDPQARIHLWHFIYALREEGLAVVLTTHYMDEAERLSDELVVMRQGRVALQGTPKAVLGATMGDQVLVIPAGAVPPGALGAFVGSDPAGNQDATHGVTQVLGEWHLPVTPARLAAFRSGFPDVRCYVRPPSLDDLFLRLDVPTPERTPSAPHPLEAAALTTMDPGGAENTAGRPVSDRPQGSETHGSSKERADSLSHDGGTS